MRNSLDYFLHLFGVRHVTLDVFQAASATFFIVDVQLKGLGAFLLVQPFVIRFLGQVDAINDCESFGTDGAG